MRPRADSQRVDLATVIERIATQLEHETFARTCHHADCPDTHYRRGWTHAQERTAKTLRVALAEHRLELALAELRASDVDSIDYAEGG